MKLPRKAYPLALSVAVAIAVGSWWAVSHRSDQANSEAGGLTTDEREELGRHGLVVLPGAQNVKRSKDSDRPDTEIVSYELNVEFDAQDASNSIAILVEELGWEGVTASVVYSHGYAVIAHNPPRTFGVHYALLYQRESGPNFRPIGLMIRAVSFRLRPGTPTPTPQRRPIS